MISLGRIQIEHPFVLAPMAGITNSPFRRLMRRLGSSMMISELISANGMEHLNRKTHEMLQFHEDESPLGLQIFGEEGDVLARAAQTIEQMGANFVDINMGCPVPKVVKKGGGAAMCRDLVSLEKILATVTKSIRIPLSIKIRTGWDESSKNALDVIKVAHNAGVEWVSIHGRTRAQGYTGKADWDFIREIKDKSPLPIIGNGDILSASQGFDRLKSSGVDAIMIGRGALRNPFLFEEARARYLGIPWSPPTPERFVGLLFDQKKYLEEFQPNAHGVMIQARKFLAWYSAGYPNSSEFRKLVFTIQDPEALWQHAADFFTAHVNTRDLSYLNEDFLMGGHG